MKDSYLPINSWAEDDRPRERLLQQGPAAMSLSELFAIILRSGVGGESALELSRKILLENNNDLNELAKKSVRELVNKYKGVGVAKAAAIVAAMEIGRRRKTVTLDEISIIRSSSDVFNYLYPFMSDLTHEEFWVVFLAQSNRVIGCECISSGGITGTVVDLRLLFKSVLDRKATNIIVAHNHPGGGILRPSTQDERTTEKIVHAGKLLDIKLFDHLIIGDGRYYSFADEGKL